MAAAAAHGDLRHGRSSAGTPEDREKVGLKRDAATMQGVSTEAVVLSVSTARDGSTGVTIWVTAGAKNSVGV